MLKKAGLRKKITTDLGTYEIIDATYTGRPARLLYSGKLEAAQSGIARDNKPELLFDYNERLMELLRYIEPRHVLLLGGGAMTLPIAIQAEFPDCRLDIVEIDATLPEIAETYFGFRPGTTVRVHIGDALQFLKDTHGMYDVVLVDVFTHTSIPTSLQTELAAVLLHGHIHKNGVVAMNLIASYYGGRSAVLRRQIDSFQVAFPQLELFPASLEPSLWLPQNFILVARKAGQPSVAPYLRFSAMELLASS